MATRKNPVWADVHCTSSMLRTLWGHRGPPVNLHSGAAVQSRHHASSNKTDRQQLVWLQLADAAIMLGNVGAAPARGIQNLPQLVPLFDLVHIQHETANAAQFLD